VLLIRVHYLPLAVKSPTGSDAKMSNSLIVSVSGVRGIVGTDLQPELISLFAAAMGQLAREEGKPSVVLGRDARTSGPMLMSAARAGLQSVGCDVIECGLVPTPTVQLAVEHHEAGGGIILTASHNPIEWNALKFVGSDGLFLDAETGARLKALVDNPEGLKRASWDGIGAVSGDDHANARHIDSVLALPVVDVDAIRERRFVVGLDCVRGVGGGIMPDLLEQLGCTVHGIHMEMDGHFPRGPEPVPANLGDLKDLVAREKCDIGLAMDPDGDRLALTDETGRAIGEDYTLSFAVKAILAGQTGPVVVNQSTSLVVDDAAREFGVDVARAKVGEANVARAMRDAGAVIGGEGNGGVMLPALHLGRDAPVATALVLGLLAKSGRTVSQLVDDQPRYSIVKAKADLGADLNAVYDALRSKFSDAGADGLDGLRLYWDDRWLHVRPSGTEPIVRMIAEGATPEIAEGLVSDARQVLASCV
jgi:phosphomannomutase